MVVGRFIWHELLTRDVPGAKVFYGKMFGWKSRPYDLGQMGDYTIVHDGDRECVGMVFLHRKWAPAHWVPAIGVERVEEAAKAAVFWGGNITAGPFEMPGAGLVLMVIDPHGAPLTLIQPTHDVYGVGRVRAGSFCAHILNTKETKRTAKFYEGVVGWKIRSMETAPGKKSLVFVSGRARVGALNVDPNLEAPSSWLPAIGVKNIASAHQKAVQLGATSLRPPLRGGKLGTVDVLKDPTGATFCLYEPARR